MHPNLVAVALLECAVAFQDKVTMLQEIFLIAVKGAYTQSPLRQEHKKRTLKTDSKKRLNLTILQLIMLTAKATLQHIY